MISTVSFEIHRFNSGDDEFFKLNSLAIAPWEIEGPRSHFRPEFYIIRFFSPGILHSGIFFARDFLPENFLKKT
jgi:hypothetical protein